MCGVTGSCVAGALSALQAARGTGVLQDRQRIRAATLHAAVTVPRRS